MMTIQIDADAALKDIEARLGTLKNKAPTVLSSAVTATAKEARKLLAQKAQETYAIKNGGFNKAMNVKNASKSKPVAVIQTKGAPIELYKFKTSPASYKTGDQKPKATKARVKAHGGMKELLVDGRWAFVTQFRSGHKTMVQRTTEKRLPIKTLLSPSIPKMIGDEDDVYGVVEPEIQVILQQQITQQIEKVIKKAKGAT